jgi:hypothetical protein
MTTLRIYAPDGSVGADAAPMAASLDVLTGCRIAVLDNGKPGADVLMLHLAGRLAERTGAVLAGLQRKGSAATPCEDTLLAELTQAADLVLTGTAD